jgi:hypothetical protein
MTCARVVASRLLLVACVALGAACARIPDDGPVVDGGVPAVETSAAPFDFSPPGPQAGATPEQIVSGFLTAQQATPLSTTVARQFLTDRAAASWQPESRTLLYGDVEVLSPFVQSRRAPVTVPLTLPRVFALDGTGRWDGRQREVERAGLQLSVVREGGEWRVADPPDAMVLPLTHLETRYRRFAVHFADPSGSVLVPEPVYLPVDVQTPTQLVEALLAGPRGEERAVDRTYLPAGTELVVSVPVDAGGVARVPLTGEVLDLAPRDLLVAAAQLVWTLRQVSEVTAVQITADGEPVSVPGIGDVVPVDALDRFSPLVASASTDLYGVRRGRVLRASDGREAAHLTIPSRLRPVTGLGVSLLGNPVAVTDDKGRVHVLARTSGRDGRARRVRSVVTGPVTRPVWDWARALWLVPHRLDGPVPVMLGGRLRELTWPGPSLEGRRVQAAIVSRDGSRLVLAVARDAGGSDLLVSRVQRSSDRSGTPVALKPARRVAQTPSVLAVGWRDPMSLVVLVGGDRQRSRVLVVPVDGQVESRTLNDDSDVLFGRPVAMAADPVTGDVRVTTSPAAVHVLTGEGRWQDAERETPLRLPTFVG